MAVLRAELLKWRRSRVLLAVLLATAVSPGFNALLLWGAQRSSGARLQVPWFEFLAQVAMFAHLLVYPLAFAFVGTYVVVREFQEGTASNLYALPVSRPGILLTKVGSAAVVLLVAVVGAVPLAVIAGLPVIGRLPTLDETLRALVLHLETGLAQFLLLPVILWLATWARNYIVPLAAAGFLVVTNIATSFAGDDWLWIPTGIPAWTAQASHVQELAPHVPDWWLVLTPIFVVFLALTVAWTARADVR
ncbi:MAG TPA: ABC transporter permease [Thermaerobacter sp.]